LGLPGIELAALNREERRWFAGIFGLLLVTGWLLLLLPGVDTYSDHTRLFTDLRPSVALPKLAPFLAVWTLMMWAMMLPSTLTTQGAVMQVAVRRGLGRSSIFLFSAGYLMVWGVFGIVAFFGDYLLHTAVSWSDYLSAHELLITGGVVLVAGIYQFTPLKEACLKSCRSPLAFILSRSRPGKFGLFVMGADHGLFCLGCCWALMLLMFAFSAANLALMVGMALYFFAEKVVRNTESLSRWTGTVALSAGTVLLIRGLWLG